jgi:hypothetical protein
MSLNPAIPGQPYPLVDAQMRITLPWYSALIRIATNAANNAIKMLGSITGGALYTNGSYADVPLTGGAGNSATANITVAGGVVAAAVLVDPGVFYQVGDALSANASLIGGTGSGFSVHVASVTNLNVALPGQPYPLVDATGRITAPWYNSLVRIANDVVSPLKPAIPGQSYPMVGKNGIIATPWYDSIVQIANDLL